MEAVNLLPEYARPGHRWTGAGSELSARRIIPLGGGAAIVAALLFAGLYFHERSTVSDKKSELATAQAHLVAQEAQAKPIKDAQAENQSLLASMRSVTASRIRWDSVLGDLGRDLPTGVFLTTLSASAAVASAPVSPTTDTTGAALTPPSATPTFTLVGTTNSHDSVALVLDRLALLPWLSNIALQSTSRTTGALSFTISASYVGEASR